MTIMKRIFLFPLRIALFALLLVTVKAGPTTNAPSFTLAWDRSPLPTVGSYTFYWGPSTRFYTNSIASIPASSPTFQITNLVRGAVYSFAVTAVTTNVPPVESEFSNEVLTNTFALPNAPTGLKIIGTQP